eukprot:TRINITY_DN22670_c0_g1_i1.p1 TRINITY_DN22670_c0_g1~~TRINITY_DN22670_c0_g1_i1.p1  ORF type:complete len:204 (+),score=53.69 TRINITY_DN22670_c0_g1_i1:100-711(+)
MSLIIFFFQAEDGIRDAQESRGLGDVYKRQRKPQAWVVEDFGGDENPPQNQENHAPPSSSQPAADAGGSMECPECRRTFNATAFEKHVGICKKVFQQKRKPFQPRNKNNKGEQGGAAQKGSVQKATSKWKDQSAQLQAAMRAARGGDAAPVVTDSSLEACPHCERRMNPTALSKHVAICLKIFKGKKKVETIGGLGRSRQRSN